MSTTVQPPAAMAVNLPPRVPSLPVVGASLAFSRGPLAYLTKLQRTYGKAARIPMVGGFEIAVFFTPTAVRTVLTEQPRNFTSREFNFALTRLLGDGLLTIDGDFHRQQRRLVQPAFHKRRIESYATTMTSHTEEMLATWHRGEVRDLAVEMQQLTLRIVAKTLFDVDLQNESGQLGKAFTDVITFPGERRLAWQNFVRIDSPLTPYGRFLRGRATLDKTIFGIIHERRASGQDSGDVLSMLLQAQDEDGGTMTDQQVRDQTMTFFAAGHETTANSLAWTFYLLSNNYTAWDRLQAELAQVLGGRTPTLDDLPNLVYTDMIIKESMRLYPPAWVIGRRAAAACEIDGYQLPAGQVVMLPQYIIQRLPEIWGANADAFVPERFDPAHPQEVPQFAYFPFGGGLRMCIGMPFAQMEARLLLATIAQRHHPRLVPGFPVVPQTMITLRPKHGLKMTIA